MEHLKPHQRDALAQLSDGKILWGNVGSGKSRVAVAYYEKEHREQDVYVITTAKKRDSLDWDKEFQEIVVGKEKNASFHGVLTVDSWNNINKYVGVKNAFFIFDEQRLVGSGAWVRAFLRIARNNGWILLSATPGDTWMDYIPVFVANGFYKNRTDFKIAHVVYAPFVKFPKVLRYIGVNRLVKNRNAILVHMRYENETIRHQVVLNMSYDEELFQMVVKDRWHIYEDRPIRDISELATVLRRVVNSDPSRIRKIRKLLKTHPKMIIFYNFNYELDILRTLSKVTEVAEWNGHKHEPLPKSDAWVYLVQYVAGSEGWNCVETDTTLFYSLTYSYKIWAQAHGRIDRMNTPFIDLNYFILKSKSWMDSAIWRSLMSKKDFQPQKIDVQALEQSAQKHL